MDITYLGTSMLVGAIFKSFCVSHTLQSLNSIHAQAQNMGVKVWTLPTRYLYVGRCHL